MEERGLYADIVGFLRKKFPNSEFAQAIKQAKKIQELRLLKGALSKKLDKTMAIFLTKVHHGYREDGIIMGRNDEPESDTDDKPQQLETQDLLRDIRNRIGKQ